LGRHAGADPNGPSINQRYTSRSASAALLDRRLQILIDLAWSYVGDEDFGQAETLFKKVSAVRRAQYGDDDLERMRAELGLAAIPAERGNTDESLRRFLPYVFKLARQSEDQGLQQAVDEFVSGISWNDPAALERAFQHIRRGDLLGPTHMYAAFIAARLGEFFERAGQNQQADEWYSKAREIIEHVEDYDQPKTREDVARYALFLNRQNRRPEAKKLFARLLAGQRAHFGSGEPTASGIVSLVGYMAAPDSGMGWRAIAVAYCHASPDHFVVATALREYARVLGEWGEVAFQEQTLSQALHILEQTGGVRRHHYAPCLLDLATVRLRQGDVRSAIEFLDRAADAEKGWLERRKDLQHQILAVRAAASVVGGVGAWSP
jgi:tetratricopeptide (TPR) repeat protein